MTGPRIDPRISWGNIISLSGAEAVEYRRTSPAILTLAGVMELTDEQVDDLFRTAMQIEA